MKIFIILFIAAWALDSDIYAQSSNTLSVFYLDNSFQSGDGVSSSMIEELYAKVDSAKNGQLLLFISNGRNPVSAKTVKSAEAALHDLMIIYSMFPNQENDVKLLRDELVPMLKSKFDEIDFSFFVTDKFLSIMQARYSALVALFPNEVARLYCSGKTRIKVNLYYRNVPASTVHENVIMENLAFNTDSMVSYKIFLRK